MVKQKRAGFTLIELLIVIVILGLLASIVAPQMFSRVDSSRVQTAETQISMLQTAVNTFRIDTGRFPVSLDELRKSEHPRWDGPYLPKDVPLDPWGNPYVYQTPGLNNSPFTIMSYGPSGQANAEDVITN
ncbi:type II secretion system protein GspG [Rheinheimera sp. D18]|uniref:type II secretion system major pseudopilin GspG n=1 Tax=Rheinheimera sp. D18 TaxID=2545632 RepID=UPI001045D7DC|nr:type II secretion system major pseudopilin GspG [Rheinheimera sp. D18]QBL09792.1 type II secretion system protein GspG [Rheinheimera sp. D18]